MGKRYIHAETRKLMDITKCSNTPGSPAIGCFGYQCPMWRCNDGNIDEAGYQIDHIVEVANGGSNDLSNLQVLCVCCHSVKTKRSAKLKWRYNSVEIHQNNIIPMDIEPSTKRLKK